MINDIKIFYSGELISLKSALIGGRINNEDESPTSIYGGPLDLDELHSSLFYINRAVIKLLTGEFDIPLEDVDEFLLSAVSEAVVKELNVKYGGKNDTNVHKIVHMRKNNQDLS